MPSLDLTEARIALIHGSSVQNAAETAGYDSLQGFQRDFTAAYFIDPDAFKGLAGSHELRLTLPLWLRLESLFQYWGRDPASLSERVEGRRISWCTESAIGPVRVDAELDRGQARITIQGAATADPLAAFHVHEMVIRWLGLHLDPTAFEQATEARGHGRLIEGRHGLTLPQTGTVFDAALWVIAGQQVSLAAAFSIRRRLTERFGTPVAGMVCSPSAGRVAEAEPDELFEHGLTRRKSQYLSGIARSARADPTALPSTTAPQVGLQGWTGWDEEEAQRRLLGIRGLGPWSVNYLLMRALGFADRVPVGDAALRRSLEAYFELSGRPDPETTLELMAPFAPYRSLASFHFWALL